MLEISLLYDKIDQHQTVYDSYDAKLAAKKIQSIKIENNLTTYSLTGGLMYNIDDDDDKHWLYEMFVSYWCNNCSTAPLPEYANNEIYQELTKEWNYFKDTSDEKLYIDMQRSKGYTDELEKLTWDKSDVQLTIKLKKSCYKKMRLRVMAYSQADWILLLIV